ncbi:extracellular solute-binding protein [[Clostridium] fimetarium]|uniref:Extracellular solute-binding protein n=1 Tax=[Clostridium] fimetarium TaxID=99656 RepID=A0A1I0Q6S3_9FIRM|nr:extracellular solute-binding protein [[Clostridium] fimetarium]
MKIAIVSILVAIAIGITVFTCLVKKPETGVKTLTVYYVKNTAYFEEALTFYKQLNTKIVLNMVAFEKEEELSEKLATDMATGTGPDVILFSDSTTLDVYKSCKGDNFADLSSYFSKDETYTDDKYFKNVIENIKTDGKQYIVPFTFKFTAYGMKKSVADKLQIKNLDSPMTYKDFMNNVLSYQKKLHFKCFERVCRPTYKSW